MEYKKILIPIYDYTLHYVEVQDKDDTKKTSRLLSRIGLYKKDIEEFEENMNKNYRDGASTFHDVNRCILVMLIYPTSNPETYADCLCHEKRHCEDFILETTNVNDLEAAGYLAGYLGKKLFAD